MSRTYSTELIFEYVVEAKSYTHRDYESHHMAEGYARDLVKRYAPGADVQLRVNPRNPQDAILKGKNLTLLWIMMIVGFLALVGSLVLLMLAVR